MEFTYKAYEEMLNKIKSKGYTISNYKSCDKYKKSVILRHDVDNSLEKALQLAKLEKKAGVQSTFFILLTSDFYNIFNKKSTELILEIHNLGHDIGLHFDEMNYSLEENQHYEENIKELIFREINIMSNWLGLKINSVSMHRPSKNTLNADYDLGEITNSYGQKFFKEYKYVSDSRRRWREDVLSIIDANEYNKLQILTHAFWYNEKEKTIEESVGEYIKNANVERYDCYNKNFSNLEEIIRREKL